MRNRRNLIASTVGIMALALPVLLGSTTAPRLLAQAPTDQSATANGQRPAFDAASIKPNKSAAHVERATSQVRIQPGSRFTATNAPLRTLIQHAYQLKPAEGRLISGVPDWGNFGGQGFDIEAKAEGNPAADQIRLMEQSLLAERFKLVVHHEMREVPVYALVVAKIGKTGPQLLPHSDTADCLKIDPSRPLPPLDPNSTPPPPPSCGSIIGGDHRLAGNKVTMETLATSLGSFPFVGQPVVDRTGLAGVFDFELKFTAPLPPPSGSQPSSDASTADSTAPPNIFTAVQEQLGLKLESTKGSVDVLVIDHVEQPSPN